MNDMKKSYYEIAQEEYNNRKGNDLSGETPLRPQNSTNTQPDEAVTSSSDNPSAIKDVVAQLSTILQEQGIQPGTPEFSEWFMRALEQGSDNEEVVEPADNASEEDNEMMEKEQAVQANQMKNR